MPAMIISAPTMKPCDHDSRMSPFASEGLVISFAVGMFDEQQPPQIEHYLEVVETVQTGGGVYSTIGDITKEEEQ